MITKNMAKPDSRWMRVRNEFEKLYDQHIKDSFLDIITTAYIVKEGDCELALKHELEVLNGSLEM